MVLSEYVNVYICNANIKRYKQLGYNVKNNTYCEVKLSDLPKGSNYRITLQCDYCGKVFTMIYNNYNKSIKNNPKSCCGDCSHLKMQEVVKDKYNVDNVANLESVKSKKKETNIRKYGCEYSIMSKEVQDKIQNTNMKKYGVRYPVESDIIKQKIINTNLEKYGVNYPLQNKSILESSYQSTMEKYGTRMFANSTSSQQKYINDFFEGELNYHVDKYYLDIFIKDKNIDIEYDGGGHTLGIKLGNITFDDFYVQEHIREDCIISHGIKIIRVINPSDIKITDEHLFMVKSIINNFDEKYNVCDYNIKENKIHYR